MHHKPPHHRLRPLGVAVLAAIATAVPAQAASADCRAAADVPSEGTEARAAAAAVCVVNRERDQRGLAPLRARDGLERAASSHARDMVRRRYFSHTTPEGSSFSERLRRTYIRGGRWSVGEALAWGTKGKATPEAIVQAWLDSPPHRRLLLSTRFRDIGIGVQMGVPVRRDRGATYAAELGVRR